jgi:ATP-dependent RNA helicase RhlE
VCGLVGYSGARRVGSVLQYASFFDFPFVPPLRDALERLGFVAPTPVQRASIAPQLDGRDLVGIAATGSGKTAAFGLPLLQAILAAPRAPQPRTCRALVLAPTRELALQIVTSLRAFGGRAPLTTCLVVGGAPRRAQIATLEAGVDVVVATPGRLIDLMRAQALGLQATRHLVIDEADRMLDLGFLATVRRIAADLPPDRQTVMFSATMPPAVVALAAQLLRDPLRVEVPAEHEARPRVVAWAEMVALGQKPRRLIELVMAPKVTSAIVFCRTRRGTEWVQRSLERAGVAAGAMHGDRRQDERARTLERFRRGRLTVLVATDLVARGIHVAGVSHVINYDLPDDPETYVHRVGRTGRAGAAGVAVTLCAPSEIGKLRAVERTIGRRLLPAMCANCRPPGARGRRRTPCAAGPCTLVLPADGSFSPPLPPCAPRAPAIPPPPPPADRDG